MLCESISSEERAENLLKTSRENCSDKTLLEETAFQSIDFMGWGLHCLETLRLNLTDADTIPWAEPTELNDEYDLAFLTLFAKENIVQLCTFPRWILKSPELAFSPKVPEHNSYFLQHLTLDSSLPFLGCRESTQNRFNCRKNVGFTPETIGGQTALKHPGLFINPFGPAGIRGLTLGNASGI